jgi:hypothetical protein
MKKKPAINPGSVLPAPEIKPLPPIVKKNVNIAKTIERKLPAKYLPPPNTPGGPKVGGDSNSYSADFVYASTVPESVEITHNLGSNNLGIFLKDSDGDTAYLTSYNIVDSNKITLYGIDRMNTSSFTVTIFANTGLVPTFNFE